MIKAKSVPKELYRNYFIKAEEYYQSMNDEFTKKHFNSCILCAIHCGISSADALTVFLKAVRHTGDRHEDVVQLIETLELDRETIKHKSRQLLSLLQEKNRAEYEERLTTEQGALTAMKNAERFFSWVKEKLPSTSP